ncbi:MAG: hypothetical protein GXO89_09520 [Chlorobi bacterium]|nr:hypothetical protein [Chlorobiota bacterium]
MNKTKLIIILTLLFLGGLTMLTAQDQIILNDSSTIDCRIISIEANVIQFKDNDSAQISSETKSVLADTIKSYTYDGKTYYNSQHRKKTLFATYNDPNTEDTYIRFSLYVPGFSFENRIAQSISINAELGTGLGVGRITENGYMEIFMFSRKRVVEGPEEWPGAIDYTSLYPFFKLEFRKYYSLHRRQYHGRATINNSANYFSLYTLAFWDDLYFVGPTWGLQRNKNRFYFNLNLGGGLYLWSEGSKIQALIDVKVGVLLN